MSRTETRVLRISPREPSDVNSARVDLRYYCFYYLDLKYFREPINIDFHVLRPFRYISSLWFL